MNKRIFIICIAIVLSCIQINAQTLTGVVYDKDTKESIPGVYVYFDGTQIVDVTDNSGKFTLSVRQMINTRLALRHVAYHTIIIENPFANIPDTIYMEERPNVLGEVVVRPQFTRQQRLRAFREQFLGTTQAGRSCKILNEDDIQTWFNVATKTLFASSDKPIEVVNDYLGYRVLFDLVDFQVEYSNITLDRDKVIQSYFAVTSSFIDLRSDNRRIKRRRDEVYQNSSTFFFRNFVNNTLNESGFRIYKGGLPTDYRQHFAIEDTLSLKMIRLLPIDYQVHFRTDSVQTIRLMPEDFCKSQLSTFSVVYRRKQSDIRFLTDALLVDQYGNIDQIDKILFLGVMGQNRAGDMLPIDYEP